MVYEETDEGRVREIVMNRVGAMVRDGLVGSLKGIGEIEAELVSLVRHTVAKQLRHPGSTSADKGEVLPVIVANALRAIPEGDTGITFSLKSVVKGTVLGVSDVCGDVQAAMYQIVAVAVAEAAKIGADVAVVTSQAIQGIMEALNETGRSTESMLQLAIAHAREAALTKRDGVFMLQDMYRGNSGRGAAVRPTQCTL